MSLEQSVITNFKGAVAWLKALYVAEEPSVVALLKESAQIIVADAPAAEAIANVAGQPGAAAGIAAADVVAQHLEILQDPSQTTSAKAASVAAIAAVVDPHIAAKANAIAAAIAPAAQ